jgi:hypothetical protein
MRIVIGALLATMLVAGSASAAETPAPPAEQSDRRDTVPVIGGHIGFVDGSRRLGPSLDLSAHFGIRKSFGSFGFGIGLRPHYERFGVGHSDDHTCNGDTTGGCAGGSMLYISQTFANAFSLEVPITAELRSGYKTIVPFLGVAPWISYMRATETERPLMPTRDLVETSSSSTFPGLGAFGGATVPLSQHGNLTARAGYRFMGFKDDVAGGRASMGGPFFNIGYMHDL